MYHIKRKLRIPPDIPKPILHSMLPYCCEKEFASVKQEVMKKFKTLKIIPSYVTESWKTVDLRTTIFMTGSWKTYHLGTSKLFEKTQLKMSKNFI